MKIITAVQLRQSLGKVVRRLEKGGEPILLARGKHPVAALISLRDYQERFVEHAALQARLELVEQIDALARQSSDSASSDDILRNLRYGEH